LEDELAEPLEHYLGGVMAALMAHQRVDNLAVALDGQMALQTVAWRVGEKAVTTAAARVDLSVELSVA